MIQNLILFASGKGSNAENLIKHFEKKPNIRVKHIFTNNAGAGVVSIAKTHQIDVTILEKTAFFETNLYVDQIKSLNPSLIILAGFLWKIPENLVRSFPDRIINIHPALLPKFGGKGMYGKHVHEAVLFAKETESGITIHFVNEHYDEGKIILQEKCLLTVEDTADSLAGKIHELEHKYLPLAVERLLLS